MSISEQIVQNTHMPTHPTIDNVAVGRRLEALRTATELSKKEFAEACGIDASSYSKIIKGDKPLKSEMAFNAATRWDVSMDYFYRGTLDKIPSSWLQKVMTHLNGKQE